MMGGQLKLVSLPVDDDLRALAMAAERKWRARHPETNRERQKRWQDRNPGRSYGLTTEQYWRMHASQNGVCIVCRRPETAVKHGKPMRLSVDHHHCTGTVRGLLCNNCNNGIGRFEDDAMRLRAAADYIERNR